MQFPIGKPATIETLTANRDELAKATASEMTIANVLLAEIALQIAVLGQGQSQKAAV
jgi:hypothetical protein